ncbi:MAG: hypothetical protein NVS3B25_22850 [Hymenobacter sp.]
MFGFLTIALFQLANCLNPSEIICTKNPESVSVSTTVSSVVGSGGWGTGRVSSVVGSGGWGTGRA